MSLFAELKRRNVFRVGIAYAVAAWIVLQITEVLSELLDLPDTIGPLVVTAVAIGFPIVLFAAWAYELTPEGIKRESEVDRAQSMPPQTGRKLNAAIFVMLVVALAYFIWESRFAQRDVPAAREPAQVTDASPAEAPSSIGADRPSIAVLPFDNRSRRVEDEPFVEGVHDDLLTNLARIGGLKVISRTSVTQYKDTTRTIPEIAAELGVTTIMEGAIQRSGDTIRVNVQLIDAQTDEHLWAEIYDRELTAANLFEIQSEISSAIANALQATLSDDEQDRIRTMPTDNLEAYDAYVRGRQLIASRNSAQLEQAVNEFRQAVTLDPDFALAWVGLADSYSLLRSHGGLSRQESVPLAQEAVDRALALDDQLGEAWATQGSLFWDQRQFDDAEKAYLRAIELSPGYGTSYHWYSMLLARYKLRIDERVAMAEKAAELDPRSPIIGVNLGHAYGDEGRYMRAERKFLDVIEMHPEFTIGLTGLGVIYEDQGRIAEAMRLYKRAAEQDPGNPRNLHRQVWNYLELDMPEAAEQLLALIDAEFPGRLVSGLQAFWLNVERGNLDGALEVGRWLVPQLEAEGSDLRFMAYLHLRLGNPRAARDWFERSGLGWEIPDNWPTLIDEYDDDGCVYAWLLMNTGDTEKGEELLRQTTRYLTEELPAADEHADRLDVEVCHLTAGDREAAYAGLEKKLAHNHIRGWDWFDSSPLYEPIRGEERFETLLAERDRRIAEEREKVLALDKGITL